MNEIQDKRDQSEFIINNKRHIYYIFRDSIITFVLWVLWFYLLFPLMAIIAWKFFGTNIHYNQSSAEIESTYEILMQFFIYNGIVIPILGVILISWGVYNRKTFGNQNRRKNEANSVTPLKLAQAYRVDEAYINTCQDARYLRIYHVDKRPKEGENAFPPLNEKLKFTAGKVVSMHFHNNWESIRLQSNFGTVKREKRVSLQKEQ